MKKTLITFLIAAFIIFFTFFAWLFVQIEFTASLDLATNADAIVVLGAASYAGNPSPVFKARLEHAAELFQKKLAPIIITTGGIYAGEAISEGATGKKFLEEIGIPADQILAEENSETTKQNLTRIAEIAKERNLSKIILVSDPFHMYRAVRIAEDLGLSAFPSPTRKSPISKNFWLELWYVGRELILSFMHIIFDA